MMIYKVIRSLFKGKWFTTISIFIKYPRIRNDSFRQPLYSDGFDYFQLIQFDVKVSQQTRDIHTMLVQCWPIVYDAGSTLCQNWVSVSCLLGCHVVYLWNDNLKGYSHTICTFLWSIEINWRSEQPVGEAHRCCGRFNIWTAVLYLWWDHTQSVS